jgi:hypothetical protein
MDFGFIDNAITAFEKVGSGIIGLIGKSKLDVTEKERLTAQVQMYGMDFQVKMMQFKQNLQMKWMEMTATAAWRTYLIYAVWGMLIIVELNNSVVAPYFPAVKTIAVNAWWWGIATALIGIEVAEVYRANKKPADPDSQDATNKTGG